MSTDLCIIPGCENEQHKKRYCVKHYFREYRHGNPYQKAQKPCSACRRARQILRREYASDLEKQADLFLLFFANDDYRVRDYDEKGRDYDLEDNLKVRHG